MGEVEPTANEPSHHRFIPYCGECGYCLEGLPRQGSCPECGAVYDPDHIVIAGWGGGGKETGLNAPPERALKLFLLCAGGMFLMAATEMLRGRIRDGVFYLVWFGVIVVMGIYNRRRLTSDYATAAHARIFPEGFGQRDGFGPCKLHPWRTAGRVTLAAVSNGRYHLRITSSTIWTLPVSIEFDCDASEAAWLIDVINRFKNVRE